MKKIKFICFALAFVLLLSVELLVPHDRVLADSRFFGFEGGSNSSYLRLSSAIIDPYVGFCTIYTVGGAPQINVCIASRGDIVADFSYYKDFHSTSTATSITRGSGSDSFNIIVRAQYYYASVDYAFEGPRIDLGSFANMTAYQNRLDEVVINALNGNWNGFEGLPSFDLDSASYDKNLGVIKNIDFSAYNNVTDRETYLKFKWPTTTSTGVDLTQDGYGYLYSFNMTGYYKSPFSQEVEAQNFPGDEHVVLSPDNITYQLVTPFKTGEFADLYSSLLAYARELGVFYNVENTILRLYLRPVYFDGSNSFFGDESYCEFTVDLDKFSSHWVADDNGVTDSGNGSDGYAGHGTTDQSAENNVQYIKPNLIDVDLSDVPSVVGQFTNSLTAFGGLFAAFFSFLPPWVTFMFIAALAISAIMIVWKAVH